VESNDSVFALDKKVTVANTEEIILQAIEKLIERDNPSLETMKMQVISRNLIEYIFELYPNTNNCNVGGL
jgi:hypothetical protein